MKDQDKYQITIETYDKTAKVFEEKFMDLDLYNESYDIFCNLLETTNPEILEIGCGPGNITRYMLKKKPGISILAIDLSVKMIELASINNPAAEFIQMDCRKISGIDKRFDGVMCGFCLPFLSREESVQLISDISGLLKKDGVLYMSTMEGDYNKSGFETTSFSGNNLVYIHYHEAEYLQRALTSSGFRILNYIRQDYPETDGTSSKDLIFIAKKQLS